MTVKPFTLRRRGAGVLLHPTSLPGPYGVGDLGPAAHRFAEFLSEAGQSWWQTLPVVPTGAGNSPYSALSTFAGSPILISLETLAGEGLLGPRDVEPERGLKAGRADYEAAWRYKEPRLRKAFEAFEGRQGSEDRARFEAFRAENASWLSDYALFAALQEAFGRAAWCEWEPALRSREPAALDKARRELAAEIRFQEFLQYEFDRQWEALQARCRELGIGLIGDVPIFVAHDSADVWADPQLFFLDDAGRPSVVAGVPPDYFSPTGQLWGNPLYRWDALRDRDYDWWLKRLKSAFARFDAVRLDHFIGFTRYWEVPGDAKTAAQGRWVEGPGADFFQKVRAALGEADLMAEDLGLVTPEVIALRDRFDLPGMRVLQFAFDEGDGARYFLPHSYPRRCVVYTGTHDNDTAMGWFRGGEDGARTKADALKERRRALRYLGTGGREFHWDLIRAAWASVADTAIVPAQDLLGLGSGARMNRPGTTEGNWEWRLGKSALTRRIAGRLRAMSEDCGRL